MLALCAMKQKTSAYLNVGLVLAIALVLACKKLQRHTGIHAASWRNELLESAINKFSKFTPEQLQRFITENFNLD